MTSARSRVDAATRSALHLSVAEQEERAIACRLAVLDQVEVAGSGHYGPAFSATEILIALYYGVMRVDPDEPSWPARDRFVMGKGHACSAHYPILADLGFFDPDDLMTFCQLGSRFGDHPDMKKVPGIDFSSGSLGHALSIGCGMAEAVRLQGHDSRIYIMLGDGELNEGQVWEAAAYAAQRGLDNLIAIVDVNSVCVDGPTTDVVSMEAIDAKFSAFGWHAERLDGHDLEQLRVQFDAFAQRQTNGAGKPTVLVADTIVGRGVSFIEGMAEWHVGYFGPKDRTRAEVDINAMRGVSK